jgi:hypothetical protein
VRERRARVVHILGAFTTIFCNRIFSWEGNRKEGEGRGASSARRAEESAWGVRCRCLLVGCVVWGQG